MHITNKVSYLFLSILCFGLLNGCRKDIPPSAEETFHFNNGMYLLNEGNMSMNKASLDFYDFTSGMYERDVYKRANPSLVLGLGDVGNDIQLYGGKLYVTVNASNKIEVIDAYTAKRIKSIDLINCRHITAAGGNIYVSSYNASIGLGPNSPDGKVVEIDTLSLKINREIAVGRQPDGLAISNNKLYVANSGGYNPNAYERTLSVIDLLTFRELKRIDIAINLHRVKVDQQGKIYVTSKGDYNGNHSNLFIVDPNTDSVIEQLDKPVSNFWLDDGEIYTYATEWNNDLQKNTILFNLFLAPNFKGIPYIKEDIAQQIAIPYGIAINPTNKHIYLTDAKNYVSPGTLYEFDAEGRLLKSFETGDLPAHMAFLGN